MEICAVIDLDYVAFVDEKVDGGLLRNTVESRSNGPANNGNSPITYNRSYS